MKRTRKGFTLVELLVVIAILAVLATVSVVGYVSFINRANDSIAHQELTQIRDYYIASKYTDEVAINDSLVKELGLKGQIVRGKINNDVVCYQYTIKTGVAYWNTTTNVISTAQPEGWAINLCDHDWADATCTTPKTCKVAGCGATEGQKLGHDMQPIADTAQAATCEGAGKEADEKCSRCDHEETGATIEALGHNWGDATCTEPKTCETCGATEGASNGHDYKAVVTAPTCTAGGFTTYTCSCGDSYVADEVGASGHNYSSEVTAPTCTAGGYTTYTCSCGDSYTGNEVGASGHSYSSSVTAPTCTTDGYTTYTCSCGDSYTGNTVAARHTYTSSVTAPTCTTGGYTTHTCSSCGNSYTDSHTDITSHNFTNDICNTCGIHRFAYTFTAKTFSANGKVELNGMQWVLDGDGGHWGYDGTKGQQLGSANNPYKNMTLIPYGNFEGVTKLVINTSGASGTDAKLTVTVGGVQIGSTVTLSTTATSYTFTSDTPLDGELVLSYTQTKNNAIYIKSIEILYDNFTKTNQPTQSTPLVVNFANVETTSAGKVEKQLSDDITMTISNGMFSTQARIYAGANAIFTSEVGITSIKMNAGYKDSTFNVYISNDGVSWTRHIQNVSYTEDYSDITIDLPDGTKYIKITATQQLRITTMEFTFG